MQKYHDRLRIEEQIRSCYAVSVRYWYRGLAHTILEAVDVTSLALLMNSIPHHEPMPHLTIMALVDHTVMDCACGHNECSIAGRAIRW
jgi:hypothetical protein